VVNTFHTIKAEKFTEDALDKAGCGEFVIIPNFLHYLIATIPQYLPSYFFKTIIRSVYSNEVQHIQNVSKEN
jgi:hypothetical protein